MTQKFLVVPTFPVVYVCIKLYMNILPEALLQDSKLVYMCIYATYIYIYVCACVCIYTYTFFFKCDKKSVCILGFFPGEGKACPQLPVQCPEPGSFPLRDGLLASPVMAHGPDKFLKVFNVCTLVLVRLASFYD